MKIGVDCEKEVAFDSPDHLIPWGTRRDRNVNARFNWKLRKLFKERAFSLLDLGCSGGAFVKSIIDDGNLAVGLEGSDYSKKMKRDAWALNPENLFTCDVSEKFEVYLTDHPGLKHPLKFDVITAWEVIEHIKPEKMNTFLNNIKTHLKPNGIVVLSVATSPDVVDGVALHQTVKPKRWWLEKFIESRLFPDKELYNYFNTQFVRGPAKIYNLGILDDPRGFNIVLTNPKREVIEIPKETLYERILDVWIGFRLQRMLKTIVVGD